METITDLVKEILAVHQEIKAAAMVDDAAFPSAARFRPSETFGAGWLLELPIDGRFLRNALLRLCELERRAVDEKAAEIGRFAQAVRSGGVDFKELQRAVLGRGEVLLRLQEQLDVDPELMRSLSRNAFRPIFEACRESCRADLRVQDGSGNHCPFCGSLPAMARLEKETGIRELWCPTCSNTWRFKRVQCPFCRNEDQESLAFFTLDDGEPYRVDVCRACEGYLKTVLQDRFEAADVNFLAEDFHTAHLDLLAGQEGFMKIIQGA